MDYDSTIFSLIFIVGVTLVPDRLNVLFFLTCKNFSNTCSMAPLSSFSYSPSRDLICKEWRTAKIIELLRNRNNSFIYIPSNQGIFYHI